MDFSLFGLVSLLHVIVLASIAAILYRRMWRVAGWVAAVYVAINLVVSVGPFKFEATTETQRNLARERSQPLILPDRVAVERRDFDESLDDFKSVVEEHEQANATNRKEDK